jgi:ribosomal protein S10
LLQSQQADSSVKVVKLPTKKKTVTVLKSPHVNSKSKEQFAYTIHSCNVITPPLEDVDIISFLKKETPSQLGVTVEVT